jgi:hypothetical protein
MSGMFAVRFCLRLLPPLPSWAYKLGHISAPLKSTPSDPHFASPGSDLAGNQLLLQHEQTAHPLCMDGQCGLRHCWLQKVGFGKLPAAAVAALAPAAAVAAPLAAAAAAAAALSTAAVALAAVLLTAAAAALTAAKAKAALALTAAAALALTAAAVLAEFRVYSSLPVLALTAAAAAVRGQWRH